MTLTLNRYSRPGHARSAVRRATARAWVTLAALTVLGVVAVPASGYAATAASAPVGVTVASSHTWTSTGVNVRVGDSISIRATGRINFGAPSINAVTPAGLEATCAAVKRRSGSLPFSAPNLQCWSLIGRIGNTPPFQVGTNKTLRATSAGELFLGVNDNRLEDNRGAWSASVSVTPRAPGPVATAKSSGGSPVLAILAALVLLAILLVLVVVLRRRAARRREVLPPTDEPLAAPVPAPVEVPMGVIAGAVAPEEVSAALLVPDELVEQNVAPVEGEFVDVNIFEVELSNGTDLRVGYNYFPEGIDLNWQVRQGNMFAHGRFPTSGGGSMYHYVTLPLGVHLEPDPGSVDVEFMWAIGGVPFRYSVRRDPGY